MSWMIDQAPAALRGGGAGPARAPGGLRGPAGFEAGYDADALPGTLPAGEAARLSMYGAPPVGSLSIEEFESTALDRLRGEFLRERERAVEGGAPN